MSAADSGADRRDASRVAVSIRALGWLVGAPLAVIRYLLVTRRVVSETMITRVAGDTSGCGEFAAVGVPGRAVHRRFSLRIVEPEISAEQLATIIATDPNLVSPWEVLRWELPGPRRRMRPGDDVLIRMAGPWNGPMRVVVREPHRLRLRTRPGNAVRGELELRLLEDEGGLVAEIELWERAERPVFALLHDRLGLTARMQTHTWAEFLLRTRSISGGRAEGPVRVVTEREAA